MKNTRKKFLRQISTGLILAGLPSIASAREKEKQTNKDPADFTGTGAPDDEKFWKRIAKKYYDTPTDYTNLENGYYGMQPKPVLQAFTPWRVFSSTRHFSINTLFRLFYASGW